MEVGCNVFKSADLMTCVSKSGVCHKTNKSLAKSFAVIMNDNHLHSVLKCRNYFHFLFFPIDSKTSRGEHTQGLGTRLETPYSYYLYILYIFRVKSWCFHHSHLTSPRFSGSLVEVESRRRQHNKILPRFFSRIGGSFQRDNGYYVRPTSCSWSYKYCV